MRLLITTDAVGGVWEYVATLARAIEAEGHALLIAIVGDPQDDQIAELPESIAIECRNHPLEWVPATRRELGATAEWLSALTRAWRSDVVHLNQMAYTGLASFPAPAMVVVHSDVVSWFEEVRGVRAPEEWSEYVEVVRAGLSRASLVVAASRSQARSTARHYGCPLPTVVHNGVQLPSGPRPTKEGSMLLTSGRAWDAAKGHATLEAALSLLPTAPSAHLVGPTVGPSGEHFSASRLICHGRVSAGEVQEWMGRATIYVAPSMYEPFGLAPVEAAMNGCALLLSDIPTFRELWDGAAVFFAKGDAAHLARLITTMVDDEETTRRSAERARERAIRAFDSSRFVSDYMSIYAGLARGDVQSSLPPSARAV